MIKPPPLAHLKPAEALCQPSNLTMRYAERPVEKVLGAPGNGQSTNNTRCKVCEPSRVKKLGTSLAPAVWEEG